MKPKIKILYVIKLHTNYENALINIHKPTYEDIFKIINLIKLTK